MMLHIQTPILWMSKRVAAAYQRILIYPVFADTFYSHVFMNKIPRLAHILQFVHFETALFSRQSVNMFVFRKTRFKKVHNIYYNETHICTALSLTVNAIYTRGRLRQCIPNSLQLQWYAGDDFLIGCPQICGTLSTLEPASPRHQGFHFLLRMVMIKMYQGFKVSI